MPKVSDETKLRMKISRCKYINKPVDDRERFWSYVDIGGLFDCWEWQGKKDYLGYGRTHYMNHKTITTHRLVWFLIYGEIPKDKDILHHCDNRSCVNPSHLFLGTAKDNSDDMIKKGRAIHQKGEKHGCAKLTEKQNLHNKLIDDRERFWSKVDIKGLFDCWEWTASLNEDGYGYFRFNGSMAKSHRVSYQFYYGEIPKGKQVNHLCHNRKCVNPYHLYAGTHQDNMNDKVNAGRQAIGIMHGSNKLTEKSVLEIRVNKDKLTQTKLAKMYGVNHRTVGNIQSHKIWKHI